jgi:glycosyltransferase involved in cell wall biosynthesis
MTLTKAVIAHSWNDVSVNIQTKAVAASIAEECKVVFVTQARIMDTPLPTNPNETVVEWPNKRPNSLKDLWFIYRLLKREKPQVAIAHFGATNLMMLGAWLARVPNRIVWMHTLSGQYRLDIRDQKKASLAIRIRSIAYKLATKVVVLNEFGRKDAMENYKVPAKKLFKIYNGIKDLAISNVNDGSDLTIRYAGRINHGKGADLLIEAFASIAKKFPSAKLELVGGITAEQKQEYLKKVEELSIKEQVIFHESLQYDQMYQFISKAYCLVVPSRMDNFPTVVLEAMATSTPLIGSKAGGIPEMIADRETGLLFETGDVQGLTDSLDTLLSNVQLRNELGKNGRKRFEAIFLMDIHVKNVKDFLKQL